jgi:DNA-binding NarL/FixJ family response regulator
MIRVLLIDDHAILRTGIGSLLAREPDITVVGQAANAEQGVTRSRALQPDVILLDVVMPRKSGFEVLPELLAVAPDARVIMLSMQTSPSSIRKALNAGAAGFVSKHASEADLFDAIRRVAAGSRYVDPELAGDLIVPDSAALTEPLSERERDVMFMLALGYTNQEVAEELYISVRTVDTHRAHLMRKLNLRTRAELVLYALANGLVGPT